MAYRLPNGTLVPGDGWTIVNDVQYPLWRMTPAELAAIGVQKVEPPMIGNYDPRFYYISGDVLVERPIADVRRTMRREAVQIARMTSANYVHKTSDLITFVLDKLVDVVVDGQTLTQNQIDRVHTAVQKLRRLSRLGTNLDNVKAEIDALPDIPTAKNYTYNLSDPDDVDPDLNGGPTP